MSDRYTVINQEEARGQSVALNRVLQDNKELGLEMISLVSKLESIKFVLKCSERKLDKELSKKETHIEKLVVYGQLQLLAELKEEILEIIND